MRIPVTWISGLACLLLLSFYPMVKAQAQTGTGPITRIIDVRDMPRPIAAQELPVRLQAVVTYDNPERYGPLVCEDSTCGIFVALRHFSDSSIVADIPENLSLMPEGTLLDIEGVTGPGDFAPIIRATRVRAVGTGPMPQPRKVSVAELHTGRFDCQRVEVRGVTQTANFGPYPGQYDLELETEQGSLVYHLDDTPNLDLKSLIDAEVIVQGVCLMYFNRRNEQVGTHIQSSRKDGLTIVTPPPPDPFGVPLLEFNRLRPFSSEPRNLHRRRISGTVTFVEPKQFLMLQNGERAVRVNYLGDTALQVGDLVEAAGFVEVREFYAELGNALVRKVGPGEKIVPVEVNALRVMGPPKTPAQRLPEDFDGRLIALTGKLLAVDERREGRHFLLETDNGIVESVLPGGVLTELPEGVRPGSSVRVTGVCTVTYTEKVPAHAFARPRSFEISLRSPMDLTVLKAAPWWTPKRLWIALAIVGGSTLLCVAWVWTLRRRVTQRARELAEEIEARQNAEVEFEATLRERKRLAADLHDTLEQSLTGLARQLEAADELRDVNPQRSETHLGLARQLLDRSQEDVRRSVWNLHSSSLEDLSLVDALYEVVEHRSADQPVKLLVEVEGEQRVLPDFVSGNLVLLAQEGITNAFKHADAKTVVLHLVFQPDSLSLSIVDDGRGFLTSGAPGPQEGHFGLQGMRERVKRMGGKLTVTSAPEKGTTVSAQLRN